METLHIVTPVTRPGNLARIAADLAPLRTWFRVRWAVLYSDRSHPDWWGGWERNEAIEGIPPDGWVWFLDDDNTVHPDFGSVLSAAMAGHPKVSGFVLGQCLADGSPRVTARSAPQCGEVDTAMFVFRRSAIGAARWASGYTTDWHFFRAVADGLGPGAVVAVDVPAVYYNALRPGVRCRVCHSPDTDAVPFPLPNGCAGWARCRSCGSDTHSAGREPESDPPGESDGLSTESLRAGVEWFGFHHRLGPDQTFLDVGCGSGAALVVMRDLGWSVQGFDVAAPPDAGPHVTVAPMFHRWLFPRRYAAILCRGLLERAESPDLLLHELHGACVPGGLVEVRAPVPQDRFDPSVFRHDYLSVMDPAKLREMLHEAMLDVVDERHCKLGQAYLCRARA